MSFKSIRALAIIGLVGSVGVTLRLHADELLDLLGTPTSQNTAMTASPLRKMIAKPTPEQNIFLGYFETQSFDKALIEFSNAFPISEGLTTENRAAMHAYLLFQNGMPLTGVDELLSVADPVSLQSEIVQMWRQAAPETHPVWSLMLAERWNSKWSQVFGINFEIQIRARALNGFTDADKVRELLAQSRPGTQERNLLQWQLVLGLSEKDSGQSAKALALLMKQQPNPISLDLMQITAARMLYQNGFLDAAISYYDKVSLSSEFWTEAQEERGWASLRKGKPQDTLATTLTLVQPSLVQLAGPEAVFLRSAAQLKVCDYKGVQASLKLFRESFRQRSVDLLRLQSEVKTKEVESLFERRRRNQIDLKDMGDFVRKIPRLSIRDAKLGHQIKVADALAVEASVAEMLYSQSMNQASAKIGFQAEFEALRKSAQAKKVVSLNQAYQRVQDLAKEEVQDTQQILSKMHIVEAELMQQALKAEKIAKDRGKMQDNLTGSKSKRPHYAIEFPVKEEIWFDELAQLNVDVVGSCGAQRSFR